MKNFFNDTFVIVDVETTGLSPKQGDRVIEIAALKVKGLKIVDSFHSLVYPNREVSYGAFMVNGISDAMLSNAPLFEQIAADFIKFTQGSILIGHNLSFDLKFISYEMMVAQHAWPEDYPTICTVKMSKALLPEVGRYSLENLAFHFNIETSQEHRALSDVQLTFDVFGRLLHIADRRDLSDARILSRLFSVNQLSSEKKEETRMFMEQMIEQKRNLLFHYFSVSEGALTFREVTPQRLVKHRQSWMLEAFCHQRKDLRAFRLDRIFDLRVKSL